MMRETVAFGLIVGFCFALGSGAGALVWRAILINIVALLG